MGYTCREICTRYKAKKGETSPNQYGRQWGGRYEYGQSKCSVCDGIFIWWEGLNCPCCGTRLSKNPRAKKSKERLAKIKSEIILVKKVGQA